MCETTYSLKEKYSLEIITCPISRCSTSAVAAAASRAGFNLLPVNPSGPKVSYAKSHDVSPQRTCSTSRSMTFVFFVVKSYLWKTAYTGKDLHWKIPLTLNVFSLHQSVEELTVTSPKYLMPVLCAGSTINMPYDWLISQPLRDNLSRMTKDGKPRQRQKQMGDAGDINSKTSALPARHWQKPYEGWRHATWL